MNVASNDKAALRTTLRAARRARSAIDRESAAAEIAKHVLALPEVAAARSVSLYVSGMAEPGTALLLATLWERGVSVLLPVVLPDLDLDWAWYEGPDQLAPARDTSMPLLEPVGARLGLSSIGAVDVVLAPGLAVGRDGSRLGQGGGSYDRALSRVPTSVPVFVLLFADETLDAVPTEPHDRRVSAAVTPEGVRRFKGLTQ